MISNLLKAKFVLLGGRMKGLVIPLQFNPETYSVEKSNNYAEKTLTGLKDVSYQYTGSKESDLSLNLLFDATETGLDVRVMMLPLSFLTDLDAELHAPPPCLFVWGTFIYQGVVSKIGKQFTYFYEGGIPARAKVSLTLKPYKTIDEIAGIIKLHSSDVTKQRVFTEGDSLAMMAYREYGDAAQWRRIAEANGIDDPFDIAPGTELALPPKKGNT